MKTIHPFIAAIMLGLLFIGFASCEKPTDEDPRRNYLKPLNPSTQASELSRALEIVGSNQEGGIPYSTPSSNLQVTSFQATASVTNDNILFIPFVINSPESVTLAYLQLIGADNYWEIPIQITNNAHTLQVGIPGNVLKGEFEVMVYLRTSSGAVSQPQNLKVEVADPIQECQFDRFPRVEGTDGITVRTYYLEGDEPVDVQIQYYMYTVPDRIDIRYNNEWIASSGAVLDQGEAPIFKQCNEVVPGDGFLGGGDVLTFRFDPTVSRKLDVYVSGCLGGGTLWWFEADCPQGQASTNNNNICGDANIVSTFDSNDPDYHAYPQEGEKEIKTLICDGNENYRCNAQLVFQTMQESTSYIAPTEDTSAVEHCEAKLVDMRLFGITSPFYRNNPIRSVVNRFDYSVTNYTTENYRDQNGIVRNHILHPGKVVRRVVVEDGKVYVVTTGEGTGNYAMMNEFFANSLWTGVDLELKEKVQEKLE